MKGIICADAIQPTSGIKPKRVSMQKKRQCTSFYSVVVSLAIAIIAAAETHAVCASQHNKSDSCSAVATESDKEYNEALRLWKSKEVNRVPFSEITLPKIHEYMRRRLPVVIVGAYAHSNLTEGVNDGEWGWEGMKRRFGHIELETKVWGMDRSNKCTSTGLCQGRNITVRELFDGYFLNKPSGKIKVPYPHDLSLETAIPEMFEAYQKHTFFAENLLLTLKEGVDHWPSLFFGARGTRTGLHVDNMGTVSVDYLKCYFVFILYGHTSQTCISCSHSLWQSFGVESSSCLLIQKMDQNCAWNDPTKVSIMELEMTHSSRIFIDAQQQSELV